MRIVQRLALLGAATFVVVGCYLGVVRSCVLDWGATLEERRRPLPGDDIVPAAVTQNTRAITIDAPADRVWPWLAQIGQDRAGFYSYRALENAVGCDMPRSDVLRPEKTTWAIGDKLWMYPPDKAGGRGYATLRVLEPGHVLGFATTMVGDTVENGSWTFVLVPIDEHTSRLLIRGRGSPRTLLGVSFDRGIFEPIHFAMERRMMVGIKALAEGRRPSELGDAAQLATWVIAFGLIVAAMLGVLFRRSWHRALLGFVGALVVFQILTLGQPHPVAGLVLLAGVSAILWWPARSAPLGAIGATLALIGCAAPARSTHVHAQAHACHAMTEHGARGTAVAPRVAMTNPLIHWELMVDDVAKTKAFYERVFHWSFVPSGPEYTLIQTGSEPGGGLMKRPPGVPVSSINSYFQVDDLDGTLRAVVEAGGRVLVPRMEVPAFGWFAMFADPEGIPIGVMQLKRLP